MELPGIPLFRGNDIEQGLRATLQELRNNGRWEMIKRSYKPKSACPVRKKRGISLTVHDMAGLFVVCGAVAALGLIISLTER